MPDAPLALTNATVTNKDLVGITWSDGLNNGGTPVIDYRVSWDQSSGNWVVLQTGVLTQSFSTVGITLVSGRTYSFKVESRNLVGYSSLSSPISVLAAQVPNKPAAPLTTISGNYVSITWTQPFDGSSPITSY